MEPKLSFLQKLIRLLLPKSLFEKIEIESKQWFLICPTCNHKKSVWETGGLRYKGSSYGKRVLGKCSVCNENRWFRLEHSK